jgi:hypothetical protein
MQAQGVRPARSIWSPVVSTPARPRHARKEIRNFADELDRGGWIFETVDSSGHTIWSHPRATGRYKLPETPRHFDVQRARRDVARLLGQKVAGKRNGKGKPKRERQEFVLTQAKKTAPNRAPAMRYPVRCRHCSHVHDAAKVTVVQRYADCSVWRCPGCGVLIDDRPHAWGGSERVKPPAAPARRVMRRLPWEDQPDNYDRGLDRLMREVPGGRR